MRKETATAAKRCRSHRVHEVDGLIQDGCAPGCDGCAADAAVDALVAESEALQRDRDALRGFAGSFRLEWHRARDRAVVLEAALREIEAYADYRREPMSNARRISVMGDLAAAALGDGDVAAEIIKGAGESLPPEQVDAEEKLR